MVVGISRHPEKARPAILCTSAVVFLSLATVDVVHHQPPADQLMRHRPVAQPDARTLRTAIAAARYRVSPISMTDVGLSGGDFAALNPEQGYRTTFSTDRVVLTPTTRALVSSDRWRLALSLKSFGRGNEQLRIGQGTLNTSDDRVAIDHDGLTSWYVNRPSGLEQGFNIAERPGAASDLDPLRLHLAFEGELYPQLRGEAVALLNSRHQPTLSYAGLVSLDATGVRLPSHFEVNGPDVNIVVDDADAVYPVMIDPTFTQEAYLKAAVTDQNDTFGMSVAISGDTAVVGAIWEDGVIGNPNINSSSFFDSGAAYVFVRSAGVWTQQAYLKASNLGAQDMFGSSVAISGDTIVVGALGEDSGNGTDTDNSAASAGAAYVFVRNGGVWTQQAYLKASNAGAGDEFGSAIAISGDTIAVAAMKEDSNATGVNGDSANNSASASGAVYVFARNTGVWSQEAYLKASNTDAADQFGYSVAVSDDTVIVGANQESSAAVGVNGNQSSNTKTWSGAAYVYVRTGGAWSQQAYLKASDSGNGDEFGASVAASGDTIAIGAQYEDSNATGVNGIQNNVDAADSGAVYVFTRTGASWAQDAYVKASNTGKNDHFGMSVALSGEAMVVGAFEDSNAVGVDGDQANNLSDNSGAAYVFGRSGGGWSQRAYLKASNTHLGDQFGWSVAVSGDTVVVGANSEDSNATGGNGTQTDLTSKFNSGAAYVYLLADHQPTANAGLDQAVEATTASGAAVTLDGSASSDSDNDPLTYAWVDGLSQPVSTSAVVNLTLSIGIHTFTLTVDDGRGGTSVDSIAITVQDTIGPSISIASPASVSYGLNATVAASFSCSDPPSGVASCVGTVGNGAALDTTTAGAHGFTVNAADNAANTSSMTVGYDVSKGSQTITFGALANRALGSPSFVVSATGGGSTSPVVFTTSTAAVCTSGGTNGSTITLNAVGTCTVRASQAGDANYDAAPDVDRSFEVQEGVTFAGLFAPWAPPGAGVYNGMTFTAGTVYKMNSTLPVKWAYAVGGTLVDSARASSALYPVVDIYGPLAECSTLDGSGSDFVVNFTGPGASTTTYDAASKTWQRNVKLDGSFQGDKCYVIQVYDPVNGTTSPAFPFKTRK